MCPTLINIMLTSPRTKRYFRKALTSGRFWQLYSHPYSWNAVESSLECVKDNSELYRWRANSMIVIATTLFITIRAAVSVMEPQSSILVRLQLSFTAMFLILTSNYQFINLNKREDLVGFTKRYLALANSLQQGTSSLIFTIRTLYNNLCELTPTYVFLDLENSGTERLGEVVVKNTDRCGLFLAFLYHGIWTDVGLLVGLDMYSAISESRGSYHLPVAIVTLDSYALICSIDAAFGPLFFLIHFIYVAIESSKILR